MADGTAGKFADSGIRELVAELERNGADRRNLQAKIAGGSDMLDFSEDGSGNLVIKSANREALTL